MKHHPPNRILRPLLFLVLCLALTATATAEDWPRWRGLRGNGTWRAPKLPNQWPAAGLKPLWKQPIGAGYAGIAVADGRVYTLDLEKRVPKDPKDQTEPDGEERVVCFDAATGKLLWSHKYLTRYGGLGGYSNGPRAMPTVHDGKVYTLGAVGHFFCFDAADGKILWSKDMVKDFKARLPEWGFSAAPLIDGDRVIVQTGAEPDGCVIAFHRLTGKEIWRSLPDPAGYTQPVLIDSKSGRQLVVWTPEHIHGIDPENGKPLWKVPYKINYGVAIATPIFREDTVFISAYWHGSKAIRLGAERTKSDLIWEEQKNLNGIMAQPLYRDGLVYTIDKSNGMTCIELATGKKLWDDGNKLTPRGRNPHASIVWLGDSDRILALNAVGDLVLARLTREGYQEQSRTKVLEGRVWGHPAFAGKHIYVKADGAEQWRGAGPFELMCIPLVE